MGAWGTGPFENDDALDWAGDLEEVDDLSAIEQAFRDVEVAATHVEATAASRAIAACHVVSRLVAPDDDDGANTEGVDDWIAAHRRPPPAALVRRALAVLARVRGKGSELAELWSDAGDQGPAWIASVEELAARLRGST